MNNEKEISFGAFDNELMHQEIFIPEGFTATIDGNKIILTRIEGMAFMGIKLLLGLKSKINIRNFVTLFKLVTRSHEIEMV